MLLHNPFQRGETFESVWSKSLRTVQKLLEMQNVPKDEWQTLFSSIHTLATWLENGVDRIEQELNKELLEHVTAALERIPVNDSDQTLLTGYIEEWQNYMFIVKFLPNPFSFLMRIEQTPTVYHKPQTAENNVVRTTMLTHWRDLVFIGLKPRLMNGALEIINADRSGATVDRSRVIAVRESFVELNTEPDKPYKLYQEEFEKPYIQGTMDFYKAHANEVCSQTGILNYVAYADKMLQEEKERAKMYLHTGGECDSLERLVSTMVKVLVSDYEEQILAECDSLIKDNDIPRLKMFYRLINQTTQGSVTMQSMLQEYIRREGLEQMKAHAKDIITDCDKYVEQLLDMYTRFTNLIEVAFMNDSRFLTVRDKAFQDVVNNTDVFSIELSTKAFKSPVESRSPELLANFCDMLLRKSAVSKRLSNKEIDDKLNNVLLVLKYVNNKDVFMRFHKVHMSRRLILETTADQEKEETLVKRFRDIGMPADFVIKLSRMLQDIEVTKTTNTEMKDVLSKSPNTKVLKSTVDMMSLKVLNVGAWGKAKDVRCTLPRELEDCAAEIEEAYRQKHCGRKIYFAHQMSTTTITWANKQGKYDIEVTHPQLSVLSAFNHRPTARLTFDDIRLATDLPQPDLARTLSLLAFYPRQKQQLLLTDVPEAKGFTDSTVFWVNSNFGVMKGDKMQPRGRLSIVGRLHVIPDAASDASEFDDIMNLRVFRLQEAIVKLMKTRRRLTSAQLQTELVELLKHMFTPHLKLIKSQLEWLIENKYIARDEKDINTFVYIA